MKYRSANRMQDFEFHDSELSLISWSSDCLTVSARYLNVHKNTDVNSSGTDMEIDTARITLSGFRVISFQPSRSFKKDESGNFRTDEPLVIHTGETAESKFKEELKNRIIIFRLTQKDSLMKKDVEYEIVGCGIDPCLTVRFDFRSVDIEWDDYRKIAWYESGKNQPPM